MAETLEEPAYEVINAHDGFEVRRYGPTVQARVQTAGRDGGAASGGFRRVAGYIFGGNSERTSIAMTAPVHMWEEDGSGWLAFTMPSAYAMETLPTPNDAGVRLHPTSVATVAVARFSGRTTPKKTARVEKGCAPPLSEKGTRRARRCWPSTRTRGQPCRSCGETSSISTLRPLMVLRREKGYIRIG